jgi:hypothetical protein
MKSFGQITTFATAVAIVASFLLAPVARSDDPLNYWRFDEGTGTTAYDSFGGPHGDVSGAQWITGQVNSALSFDGGSDSVHVPESPEWLLDSFSLQLWIKTTESHLQQGTILATFGSSWGTVGFGIGIGGSVTRQGHLTEVSYRAEPLGPKVEMNSTDAGVRVDDNEWHLITLVRNTDIGKGFLYVDGLSVCERDDIGGTIDIPRDLSIGTHLQEGQYYPFYGAIDEVALYNRALSLEEIERHHRNGLAGWGYCIPEPSVFLLASLALLALIRPRR